VEALYVPSADVLLLTPSTCKSKVMNFDGIALVEFFAPWRGHYQALTPIWERVCRMKLGNITVF